MRGCGARCRKRRREEARCSSGPCLRSSVLTVLGVPAILDRDQSVKTCCESSSAGNAAPMTSAEEEILEAVRSECDRERGYRQLCELFRPRIRGYFAGKRYSNEDQEDLTQEVFLRVSKSMAGFHGSAGVVLRVWIFRITESVHWSRIRTEAVPPGQARRTVSLDEAFPEGCEPRELSAVDPLSALLEEEKRRLVRRELRDLPKQARIVSELYYVQGRKVKEIALALNLKPDTVKAHLYQVRQRMKAKQAKQAEEPAPLAEPPNSQEREEE